MNTEKVLDAFDQLDIWPVERSLSAIIAASAQAVGAVKAALPQLARAADGVELKLAAGGRLLYLGAGTSGRLALQDAAELLPTFGFDRALVLMAGGEEAGTTAREDDEDNEEGAWAAIEKAGVTESDIAIGLSASGRTPYTVAGVTEARRRGALTVGIANNPGSALLAAAEVPVLLDTGPEVLAGSTRLAAGTAQKVALNALSTAVLARLGGAYGNLMVGMRPINDKLRRRAIAIVASATGSSEDAARAALKATDWGIREAIVALETDLEPERVRAVLARSGNRVREALRAAGEGTEGPPNSP
ncbi:MAG: N-acetylmuramic acid 6-phosphate etherase [Truepera sp.]|nr:N-acetylmuramic acid 6-phosphate etherase [Truepera sp.]